MKPQRSPRGTAALAVFLLFAALLGVTRADASLTKAADVAGLSRPALQLPTVAPTEPSRFGFAEDLALLNVEKEAPRFSLIEGVETRRFERTYARNNPLKFVDPNGLQVASTQSTGQFLMAAGRQAMVSANGQAGFRLLGTVLGGMSLAKLGDLLTMGTDTGTAVESGRNLGEALSADISRGIIIGSVLGGIAGALRSAAEGSITEISVSSSRFGEAAAHIEEAQAAGQPSVLTIDRAGASARRADAMRGVARVPGLDRDEYPPAMFKEGGEGASVRTINRSDNRACGAFIGNQCSGLSNGQTVRIVPSD